jgi:hypothetical protein
MSIETQDTPAQEETFVDDVSLEDFTKEVFGKPEPKEVSAPQKEDTPEEVAEAADPTEDELIEDALAPKPDPEEATKPKKNRFQERIDELTGKTKAEERGRLAAEQRAEELESRLKEIEKRLTTPDKKETSRGPTLDVDPNAPDPTDTETYPLGEFDPSYVRDNIRYYYKKEAEEAKTQEVHAKRVQDEQAKQTLLTEKWNAQLEPAQERYPDFMDKGEQLLNSFSNIDPNYGEYLTSTLMSMEHGADVMYFLSTNLDEAKRIINSGPLQATLALGRIESKFTTSAAATEQKRPKVTNAPVPPPANKGSQSANKSIDDEDNLDAFAAMLFKK